MASLVECSRFAGSAITGQIGYLPIGANIAGWSSELMRFSALLPGRSTTDPQRRPL